MKIQYISDILEDMDDTIEFCLSSVEKLGGDKKTLDDVKKIMCPHLQNRVEKNIQEYIKDNL